jgi:uncharacterized membrane protein
LNRTKFLVQAALIAAVYAALTVLLASISYGGQQFRVSEALTVLPAITPAAIPGLFVGCILANAFSPLLGLADMIFGSLATLIAACASGFIAKATKDRNIALRLALIPLPPVVVNAIVVGTMLWLIADIPFVAAAAGVFVGQAGACYLLGCPLYLLVENLVKNKRINLEQGG